MRHDTTTSGVSAICSQLIVPFRINMRHAYTSSQHTSAKMSDILKSAVQVLDSAKRDEIEGATCFMHEYCTTVQCTESAHLVTLFGEQLSQN